MKKSGILTKKPVCKICFKQIKRKGLLTFFAKDPPLCESCFRSLNFNFETSKFCGCKITSLAEYKPPLSNLLIQYKENRDVELSGVFLSYYSKFLRIKYLGYSIVLVPSSPSKIKEREFDHLEIIFKNMNLPILKILVKKDGNEQKKNSLTERKNVYKYIKLTKGNIIEGKKILLVDDVITTGSTLKACLNLLEKQNPKKIEILTIMHAGPLNQYSK